MQLKTVEIKTLKSHPKNYNQHPAEQVKELQNSLEQFGQVKNIVVWKGQVIAGNGLLAAAKEQGQAEIEVQDVSDWDEQKALKFMFADNRLAELAITDDDMLAELFEGFDDPLDIPGIDEDFLEGFDLGGDGDGGGLTGDDEVPEDVESIVKAGELWLLDEHRLLCADCMVQENVERLMDDEKGISKGGNILISDPPYGIKRDKGFGGSGGFGGHGKPIKRRTYVGDDWDNDIPTKRFFDSMLQIAEKVLLFGGNFFAHLLPQGKHWVVWDKKNTMPTFGDAELIWTNIQRDSVKIKEYQHNGLIGREKERFHPTQKPVALIEELIVDYSEAGDIVLDPFLGSGSTLIACEKTNRKCYGTEIDEHYCTVILQRWAEFTGKIPVREDGKKWTIN